MMYHDDKDDHAHDEHGDSEKHDQKCETCGHAHEAQSGKCAACGCG